MDSVPCPGCMERDRRIAELEKSFAELQAKVDRLTALLEQAQRSGKRQSAPFSKGEPKDQPKTPGRKRGDQHGQHGHRPAPPDETVDEVLEAPLPDACPHCGGALAEDEAVDEQFQTDIPLKPIRRKFRVHKGCCTQCGKRLRGRHPLQTSDAVGAAASQVGPDAQAAIVVLNKQAGLSHGKISDTLDKLFGISLTRGASAQIVLRAADKLRPAHQEIRESLKQSPQIIPDETGWRIGGHPAWLHVWVGDQATGYVIDPQRSADALEQVIGIDYSGTMIHDGFASYDRFEEALHQQCVAHPLRRAHDLEKTQTGRAKAFPRQVIDLFKGACQVRDDFRWGQCDEALLEAAHERYVNQLLDLTERRRTDKTNATFAKHLYHHAEQWFLFLLDPTVPATSNAAERALRGPIVNRKVWGGNRTAAGANAQAILCSVLATCKQQSRAVLRYLSETLRGFTSSIFNASLQTNPACR